MLDILTQFVLTIGRKEESAIIMLGTGVLIAGGKYIVTPRHVVGDRDDALCVILPTIHNFDEYQDTSVNTCSFAKVKIKKSDPFRDIVLLEPKDVLVNGIIPTVPIGQADDICTGDEVYIIGFPHCTEGRRVLTMQKAMVGAKILLNSSDIKAKYFVINTQTRPGQSGSMIYSHEKNKMVGMLIGAFAPDSGISLGGINPRELHQTTQCVSAEYIYNMIKE